MMVKTAAESKKTKGLKLKQHATYVVNSYQGNVVRVVLTMLLELY